jgi:DDE superfamily endonuclease
MRAAREDRFDRQPDLDPDRLVFLDETAATTKMVRRYGRAPCDQRRRIAVPHGHYKTTTITAALLTTGLIARSVFDGATNGMRFRAFVTDTLAPVLRSGNTVILDHPRQSERPQGRRGARGHRGGRRTGSLPPALHSGQSAQRRRPLGYLQRHLCGLRARRSTHPNVKLASITLS